MDDRLENALAHGRFRETFRIQQKNLEFKMKEELLVNFKGGMFEATEGRIAYLSAVSNSYPRDRMESIVVLDDRNLPIYIDDIEEFRKAITTARDSALNGFYTAFTALQRSRTVKAQVGI